MNPTKEFKEAFYIIEHYPNYSDSEIISAMDVMLGKYYTGLNSKQRGYISDRLFDMKMDSKYICTYVIGTRPNPGFYADQILWMGYASARKVFEGCWDVIDPSQRVPDAVVRFDDAFNRQLERDKGSARD